MKWKILFFYIVLYNICGLYYVSGRRKRDKAGLRFSDCGKDPRRPIQFRDIRANPMPIVTPGTLYLTFAGNLTRDLPRSLSIELEVVKYLIGIPFPLPCFDNNLGSCLYENMCANLEKYESEGCPKTLKQFDIQCHCPFHAGEFHFKNLPLNIPKIKGFASAFVRVRGDYGLTFRVMDDTTEELGCLHLQFSVKKRYRGWLFQI